ncbi:HAD family hydrolase [Dyadobacter arcticus]|uniref:Hydrolase of the HAD superfamily n=1 Tax=Dyadobacter arcticus TaxID=1078754 RepID=A0ABX0UQC2_9BACT|nr:HAD family hydrolase [Dyadobacter arcticus]NIJ55189.1 putative hydrolase of the HAD superfamily [Dyadobacter arcticus]
MPFYIHYSFDLWHTLIKPNPDFKKERTRFFYENLNYGAKSLEEIEMIFREVDVMCNAINEKTGRTINADQMYLMVISSMNNHCYPVNKVDLDWLFEEMDALLFRHMPLLYSLKTFDLLNQLKEAENTTMSIVGNTGFNRGNTLRTVLNILGISKFFDVQFYSDETGMSKPNPRSLNFY